MSADADTMRDAWLNRVPEDGNEAEVGVEFHGCNVTAAVTVFVVGGVVDVQVDGLLYAGLYLDADDLSDSAQQRIAELARAVLLREDAE